MEKYPICETIEEYEPQFDDVNNCYRDMNNSEIKIKKYLKKRYFIILCFNNEELILI